MINLKLFSNCSLFSKLRITFRIAEDFELDPKGMLLGGASPTAKRFGLEHIGAGNAWLCDECNCKISIDLFDFSALESFF